MTEEKKCAPIDHEPQLATVVMDAMIERMDAISRYLTADMDRLCRRIAALETNQNEFPGIICRGLETLKKKLDARLDVVTESVESLWRDTVKRKPPMPTPGLASQGMVFPDACQSAFMGPAPEPKECSTPPEKEVNDKTHHISHELHVQDAQIMYLWLKDLVATITHMNGKVNELVSDENSPYRGSEATRKSLHREDTIQIFAIVETLHETVARMEEKLNDIVSHLRAAEANRPHGMREGEYLLTDSKLKSDLDEVLKYVRAVEKREKEGFTIGWLDKAVELTQQEKKKNSP